MTYLTRNSKSILDNCSCNHGSNSLCSPATRFSSLFIFIGKHRRHSPPAFVCFKSDSSLDSRLMGDREASTRVGNAYEGLVCCWSNSPVDACSWVMESWYEDQVAAISSFQGEMNLMGAILDSLNPVSTETLCPTNSRISSIIWGSFSYLLIEANPEGGLSLAIEQVSCPCTPS